MIWTLILTRHRSPPSSPQSNPCVAQYGEHLRECHCERGMGILKMFDTFLQLLKHAVWRVNILGAFQQIVNFLIKAAQEGASLFIEVLCLCHLVSKFFQN